MHIEKVAKQRRESEQCHRHRDKDRSSRIKRLRDRLLHVQRPGIFRSPRHTGNKAHHGCCRTKEKRIDIHRNHLRKPLLYRMRNMSRSSRVRRRPHASFVRIKSALDAIHQARTRDTAANRFEVKCIAHYGHNNRRNHVVIYNQNNIHEEHIEKPHERNKHACHLYDSFAATEQAKAH